MPQEQEKWKEEDKIPPCGDCGRQLKIAHGDEGTSYFYCDCQKQEKWWEIEFREKFEGTKTYSYFAKNPQEIKNFISLIEQKTIERCAERILGMTKNTHKEVEARFWSDGDKLNGEFEMYGEYEDFFKFAKKTRNKTIKDAASLLTNEK